MTTRVRQRSNEQWIDVLSCAKRPDHNVAVIELQRYLRSCLSSILRGRRIHENDLDDFVQEATLRLLARLASFRGDSRFTTWATAIATRVAFTELRRRDVQSRHDDHFARAQEDARQMSSTPRTPEHESQRLQLFVTLDRLIRTELSERQRAVIIAELRGVPTVEIAARLNTNANALYKVAHDARRKLRAGLLEAGFNAEMIAQATRPEGAS